MKSKIIFIISLSCSLFFYACNSVGYEIEESEDQSTDGKVASELSAGEQQNQIQATETNSPSNNQSVNSNSTEKNSTENSGTLKLFSIQIGAFSNESFAQTFSENAKNSLKYDVYVEKSGGLFKLKLGKFASIQDAANALDEVRNSGYKDSFVIEAK